MRDLLADQAPDDVVVDSEVTVDQSVAGGDDHPLWDLGVGRPHRFGDVRGRFADQLQVAQGRVVNEAARLRPLASKDAWSSPSV